MLDSLNRNLRYLFVLNFAFGFSIQLITPLFPLFVSELGASASQNALVISVGGLVSTILMIPSGLMIDRIGRKVLLIGSAIVNLISIFLFSYASSWQQVTPLFMLYNASWALFIPARMAMITANSDLSKRSSVFGIMNTSWPIAGIISTLTSGYLIEYLGWNQVFLVGAVINAFSILAGFKIDTGDEREVSSSEGLFKELLRDDILGVLSTFFIYGALMTTAIGGVNLIVPLYLESKFALSASKIALFFTLQSFITLITQMPSGRIADRYGRKKTILSVIVFIPFLFASWHLIDNWRIMLILNSLAFGLWSMTWPAILTLLSSSVPERLVGPAFGVNTTGNRLGTTIGPIIASFFYVNYSKTSPFLVAAAICSVGFLFAYRLNEIED
ncbi:MFS transporter [Candidatus Bathyarchaeota archaeon]|nr:MFS transporter [Candidatus Bathyarchaeota archaeon]